MKLSSGDIVHIRAKVEIETDEDHSNVKVSIENCCVWLDKKSIIHVEKRALQIGDIVKFRNIAVSALRHEVIGVHHGLVWLKGADDECIIAFDSQLERC